MNSFVGERYHECKKDGKTYLRRTTEWDNYLKKRNMSILLTEANMNFLDKSYNFETYRGADEEGNLPKLKKYIGEFERKFKSVNLYLHGIHGTQKTITAGVVGKNLLEKGYSIYYISMVELFNLLVQKLFDKTDKSSLRLERIERSDFLIIDSFFSYDRNKNFLSEFDSFLRCRIEERRQSVCFISHFSVDRLVENGVGNKSILSFVKRSTYPMIFKDVVNDFDIDSLFT